MNNYFWINVFSFAIFRSCAHKHNYAENTDGRKLRQKYSESLKLFFEKNTTHTLCS